MTYSIQFSKEARNYFKKLEKNEKEQIIKKLQRICVQPEKYLIKLINSEFYKLKAGNFRLFIDLQNDKLVVLILEIGKRKNIYKKK